MRASDYAERGDCPGMWWCSAAERAATRVERVALCTECWERWLTEKARDENSESLSEQTVE